MRGRKKSQDPKNYGLRVRLTSKDYQELAKISEVHGKTMSEIIRKMIENEYKTLEILGKL